MRFTEEQIISILKEHETGVSVAELCRKHGVKDLTVYNWKAKFSGMEVSEAKRLKATNRRRPILMLEEDTSPGRHDSVIAACDVHRYAALGCREYHDNCTDNLYAALGQINLRAADCPAPLNLWMNIPVGPDGKIVWGEPLGKRGDHVTLRAVMDCIVVMSTCPQDMIPINAADCQPTEVHYRLLD